MAISQNFKTQVVFGGRIDPSFRRGTTELNDAIRQNVVYCREINEKSG